MTDNLTLPELKQLKLQKVMQRNRYRIEGKHKEHDGVEIELMYINQEIEKLTKKETRTKTSNQ